MQFISLIGNLTCIIQFQTKTGSKSKHIREIITLLKKSSKLMSLKNTSVQHLLTLPLTKSGDGSGGWHLRSYLNDE